MPKLKEDFSFCITKNCNMKCGFCIWDNFERSKVWVDPAFFKECILKMKAESYEFCGLVGGEVALHPQFRELCDILVANKMKFTFVTNAKQWELYKFLFEEDPYRKWLSSCAVSLDGKEETHDKERGEGSYKKVIEFLEYTKEKIDVTIKMCVRNDNYQDMEHIVDIGEKYGREVELFGVTVSQKYLFNNEDLQKISKILEGMMDKLKRNDIRPCLWLVQENALFCGALGSRELNIYPDGTIGFCCAGLTDGNYPFANIKNESVKDILKKKSAIALKIINATHEDMTLQKPITIRDKCSLCRKVLGCLED